MNVTKLYVFFIASMFIVGLAVGFFEGEGFVVRADVGSGEGLKEGTEGKGVGRAEGAGVGLAVGLLVGAGLGLNVGRGVGAGVVKGAELAAWMGERVGARPMADGNIFRRASPLTTVVPLHVPMPAQPC